MLSSLIPSIIILTIILVLAASAVIAFLTQKNWATVSLLAGTSLLLVAIAAAIFHAMNSNRYSSTGDPITSRYGDSYEILAAILFYISPFIILIGMIGYMKSSRSIYLKAEAIQAANQKLATKLNNNQPRK